MYPNYINDRKALGLSCIRDIEDAEKISCLLSTLEIQVICIVKKGHQTGIFIFSKEFLFNVTILLKCLTLSMTEDTCFVSPQSTKVYQCCISKSNNLGFKESLKSPSPILDSILKFKGGSDELNEQEIEKLVKSIIAKTPP